MIDRILRFYDAPPVTGQTASEMIIFLYELINAVEHAYGEQLWHYNRLREEETQADLFAEFNPKEDFEDDIPF